MLAPNWKSPRSSACFQWRSGLLPQAPQAFAPLCLMTTFCVEPIVCKTLGGIISAYPQWSKPGSKLPPPSAFPSSARLVCVCVQHFIHVSQSTGPAESLSLSLLSVHGLPRDGNSQTLRGGKTSIFCCCCLLFVFVNFQFIADWLHKIKWKWKKPTKYRHWLFDC